MELSLDIPFIKLKFYAEITETTVLPADKVSALRGGMGEMMLRQHCAADRDCDACRFTRGCIIRNAFYSRMDSLPPYVTGQESVGYLLECEDRNEDYRAGDILQFRMILFGDSITYFFIYLQALVQLGAEGLGKYKSRFRIAEVRNASDRVILAENSIDKSEYRVDNVADYVKRKKRFLLREKNVSARATGRDGCLTEKQMYGSAKEKAGNSAEKQENAFIGGTFDAFADEKRYSLAIEFCTPLSMKYQGEYLRDFEPHALVDGACRRIQMLDYYTGQETELPVIGEYPSAVNQSVVSRSIRRYSSTHDAKIRLFGIAGRVLLTEVSEQCLDYLLAGELLHIGKNSSFGFGKYLVLA